MLMCEVSALLFVVSLTTNRFAYKLQQPIQHLQQGTCFVETLLLCIDSQQPAELGMSATTLPSLELFRTHPLSSLSHFQGTQINFVECFDASGDGKLGSWQLGLVWAASKTKKKGREKRKAGGAKGKGWSFDQLMLVWDDAFEKCCEDAQRVATLRSLGKEGVHRYGSGCVLVQETVRTLPRGSASGFSYRARSKVDDSDEPPPYTSQQWTAEYVPRTFVLDPSLAPDVAPMGDEPNGTPVVDLTDQVNPDAPLVSRGNLISILRGMDRTRILGLTADEGSTLVSKNESTQSEAVDAGEEEPYNPGNEELVLMLAVIVDGQPAVGADVVRAFPAAEKSEGEEVWKLEMRDIHTLPV